MHVPVVAVVIANMNSDDLFRAFESFYTQPGNERSIVRLINVAINYNFPADTFETLFEIAKLKKRLNSYRFLAHHNRIMQSNTGSRYSFVTEMFYVLEYFENFIKGSNVLVLLNSYYLGRESQEPQFFQVNPYPIIQSNLSLQDHVDYLEKHIVSSDEPVNLMATPSVWVPLTTHDYGIEMLSRNQDKIQSIINTDFDMFLRKKNLPKIPLNDQMIDWSSGGNFYTCHYGVRHWLPLFSIHDGKYNNLLNLSSDY